MSNTQTFDVVEGLRAVLTLEDANEEFSAEAGSAVESTRTFSDAGVLTQNDGLVLRLNDGTEFQVTVVRSR